MTTIRDVARRAGVAPITVSRVINDADYVSDSTRERVEQAITELGYVPNMLGPSLRFKQTRTVALILTDITNPFWTTVARGVEDAANERDYNVILCNSDESETKQANYLNLLLGKQIDGALLAPARSAAEPAEKIQQQGVPVVILDRQVPYDQVDVVRCDSEGGAYQLTRHLLALGHQRITMLTGPRHVSTACDRVDGYRRALAEAGLQPQAEHVTWGEFSQESGYRMAQKALITPVQPTAIFAANNFIAFGAMRALEEEKLRVPEDMALVAFDDLPPGLSLNPFLTAAVQPAYEMGRQAMQLLFSRLSGDKLGERRQIVLPVEIVIRQSSGRPVGTAGVGKING